jgi:hypothetical protein
VLNSPGFHTVIWLAGYKDGLKNIHQERYVGHDHEAAYKSGHLEGIKDRLKHETPVAPRPADVVARIREQREVLGG